MNFQALLDGMFAQWQRERAETQMTLGKLIAILEKMPPETPVANLCNPHSYRGYYSDLAFEQGDGTRNADELLQDCRAAMVNIFHGYKGGDFVMGALTPLWVANWSCCGNRLMNMAPDGQITTAREED